MIATTVIVAVVAHAVVDDLSRRLVRPRHRLADRSRRGVGDRIDGWGCPATDHIVEGESLINERTASSATAAVAAAATGGFSVAHVGLAFAAERYGRHRDRDRRRLVVRQVRRRLDNPPIEITIALLTGYVAFIPAELVGASALAAVTVGIHMGAHTSELTTARRHGCRADAVWEIVVFMLNALLFVLIGLQPR